MCLFQRTLAFFSKGMFGERGIVLANLIPSMYTVDSMKRYRTVVGAVGLVVEIDTV